MDTLEMDTLEQNIETAAGRLPVGWRLRIDIENGWGGVTAVRPDGSEVDMDKAGKMSLSEQVAAVTWLALKETQHTTEMK